MENVVGGSEIVIENDGEMRPHEVMILVRDEDGHVTQSVARIVDCQLVHHRCQHSLMNLNRRFPPTQTLARDCSRMLHYLNCGILLSMYGPLIGLVQVKFQNNNQTPFETHNMFMIMSVIAFSTSGLLAFRLLVYTTTINLPSIYYTTVSSVVFFLAVLAPLSLVLVLFVPQRLLWIGYSIVCILFVTVITYNFMGYISLFGNMTSATWKVIKWLKLERQLAA